MSRPVGSFNLVSEEEDKAREVRHIQNALFETGYKRWMFKVLSRPSPTSQENSTSETTRPISVGLSYVTGLSAHLSRVFRHKAFAHTTSLQYVEVHLSPSTRQDTKRKEERRGIRHHMQRLRRTLEKRLGEHQKQTTSAIQEHQSQANHEIDWKGVKILD